MTTISNNQNAENVTASAVNVENNFTTDTKILESSESEFNRTVIESLDNRVRVTDKDEATGLELFCYVHCSPEDDSIIHQCRGVVFHENNIVMRAFPYTLEYAHTEKKQIEEKIHSDFKDCSFYDSHEGALVRMFNFSGRWYTSTHRKLNAFHSKWASKESFGTSFKRALEAEVKNNKILKDSIPESGESLLERFQSTLDTTKQYMFLVLNTEENRIVCDPPSRPTLFHVGTFVDGKLVMTENINIPHSRKHTFVNIDELVDYVSKVDIRNLQGVIVFAPGNKQYKILHKNYQEFFNVRGNEPSIKYRYLQVRMNSRMVNMLYYLYPDMNDTFDKYENTIYAIAKMIYSSYVDRYIKKIWVSVAKEEFNVIRECHKWHEEDRKKNRITLDKVIEKLNEQNPTNLNKMIRRFHNEKYHENKVKSVNSMSHNNKFKKREDNVSSSIILNNINKRDSKVPLSPKIVPLLNTVEENKTD